MMTRSLKIAEKLSLPLDTVTSTLVIYGGKGMGKTNLGSVLVEELTKARLRWSALDPLGVWWGLRHSKDGKGPGIECLILGGVHGDMPIEPTGGQVVADLVVDEPTNVIIDFSRKPSGEMWGIGEKTRFVTDYARRLFQRQGELIKGERREPIFQLLDEAARYIPQIIPAGNPDLAKCVSAWDTLVEEGRNVGIGVGLLTQRSARMNKSVSEVADAMFSFRIVGPNSIAAVMDWLGEHVPKDRVRAHIETLRSLERGRCLVVSPGWLHFEDVADIRARATFDSSATPKPGERQQRVVGEGAKPDLAKYADRMKATIERAKAEDPRELRKRIAQLESDLKKQPTVAPPAPEVPILKDSQIAKLDKAISKFAAIAKLDKTFAELAVIATDLVSAFNKARTAPPPVMHVNPLPTPRPAPVQRFVPPIIPKPTVEVASTNRDLSGAQHTLLRRLAEFRAMGREQVNLSWLAASLGTTVRARGFEENIRTVRKFGYVDVSNGRAFLTDPGLSTAGEMPALSGEQLRANVKQMLSGPQSDLLKYLDEIYPHPVTLEQLAEQFQTTVRARGFEENIRTLRTNELITVQGGSARCADWLFQ